MNTGNQENKTLVSKMTFEDLAKLSEENSEIIRQMFLSDEFFNSNNETFDGIMKEYTQKIVAKMHLVIDSMANMRQFQPTRFNYLFMQELLRISEEVKREGVRSFLGHGYNYDVERDIKNTRKAIEVQIANEFKMELALWELLKLGQNEQALTIIEALELQMESKPEDLLATMEILNYKIEVLAKLGNEQEFFSLLDKMLKFGSVDGVDYLKYDELPAKNLLVHILIKKFPRGIPMSFNFLRTMSRPDPFIPLKAADQFRDLLVDKLVKAVLVSGEVRSSKSLNDFLNREWDNIVSSFKLINVFVREVRKPEGLAS